MLPDILYLALIIAAFVALLGYVRFCAWTGRQDADARSTPEGQ